MHGRCEYRAAIVLGEVGTTVYKADIELGEVYTGQLLCIRSKILYGYFGDHVYSEVMDS